MKPVQELNSKQWQLAIAYCRINKIWKLGCNNFATVNGMSGYIGIVRPVSEAVFASACKLAGVPDAQSTFDQQTDPTQ